MIHHLLIGISGYSGVGKDEIAKWLVKNHKAHHTGLADPAKRHMADLYGFTEKQLFGPSSERNRGDLKYPKPEFYKSKLQLCDETDPIPENLKGKRVFKYKWSETGFYDYIEEGDPKFWLSPREALQQYCGLMNDLHLNTWIHKGVEIHKKLANVKENEDAIRVEYKYRRIDGIVKASDYAGWEISDGYVTTCFSDIRHKHEISYIRNQLSERIIPVLVRIKRPSIPLPPFDHRSELEQSTIDDDIFDFIINNDGTLQDLEKATNEMMKILKSGKYESKTVMP